MTDRELFGGRGDPGHRDRDRIVLHVDMDCFYAACERRREPSLRGEPLVVGMGYDRDEPTGAVATASYEAREYGIESAQSISAAMDRLPPDRSSEADDGPTAHYRPVDLDYYSAVSREVHEILEATSDRLRKVSIDEAYLDVSDRTAWNAVESFVQGLKDRIESEVGVTASVGVAPTMSTAKIASDFDKPDGMVIVRPGTVREFLSPLDVDAIHGVGPVTAEELADMGIETVADLGRTDPTELETRLGETGRTLYNRARGVDPREVTPRGDPKSLSRERSIDPTSDQERLQAVIRELARDVDDRARTNGVRYQTIGIKVVTTPYSVHTREESLSGPIRDADLLEQTALDQVNEFGDDPVRKLGVRVSNLDFTPGEQLQFDSWSPPDWAVADHAETGPGPGQTKLRDFL